jgi:hypothetical protein
MRGERILQEIPFNLEAYHFQSSETNERNGGKSNNWEHEAKQDCLKYRRIPRFAGEIVEKINGTIIENV